MPATYTFLPWLRQGISNEISETDNFNAGTGPLARANLQVDVNIEADSQQVENWQQAVPLIGPGDIVGLNKEVIIRHEPSNWITNFEPHHLPFIEFYDEDFPWRYSPATPDGNRLRPWLYLLLLKPEEFKRGDPLAGPLPFIKLLVNSGAFPPPAETWAWAHVQVNKKLVDLTGSTEINELSNAQPNFQTFLSANPDIALSRLIATRKLEPEQDYHAFLIPAFETGRLAGLGSENTAIDAIEAQTAAWGNGQADHPFYHETYFRTGPAGDFEHLVRQIMPRPIDTQVGRRPMDIQDPGYLLNRSEIDPSQILESQPHEDGTLFLEGALRVPENDAGVYPWAPNAGHFTPFVKRLEDLVNLGEDLLAGDFANSENSYQNDPFDPTSLGIDDDPVVAPPMYGRWHSLTARVDRTDLGWVHELNLDPRQRAIAGLGSKLIQDKQEDYMEQAWSQLGNVVEANSRINIAQLAAQVSEAIYGKHIRTLKPERVAFISSPLHSVIPAEGATPGTFFSQLSESQLPNATLAPGFRKIIRKNGPIGKKVRRVAAIETEVLLSNLGDATLTAAPTMSISPEQNQVPISSVQSWANTAATQSLSQSVFAFTQPGDHTTTASAGNQEAQDFQESVSDFYEYFKAEYWELPGIGQVFDPGATGDHIGQEITPGVSIAPELADYIEVTNPTLPSHAQPMVPILAAPNFPLPVFDILKKDALEWFLPNLHLIPQNTISLLETNPKFIESLFVGMNHEMARELLWRGYPTDQRGSYFRNFWENNNYVNTAGLSIEELDEGLTDIPPIHAWASNTELGTHTKKTESFDPTASSEGTDEVGKGKLVMVFRGDLLKKFPHVSIYAVKAEWDLNASSGDSEIITSKILGTETRYPLFLANLEPDIVFLGFDLTVEEAKGDEGFPVITGNDTEPFLPNPGWFFILKERPGELRFGLDVSAPVDGLQTWKDLYWKTEILTDGHLDLSTAISVGDAQAAPEVPTDLVWGPTSNAADIASILMQDPVKAAIHAKEMLG